MRAATGWSHWRVTCGDRMIGSDKNIKQSEIVQIWLSCDCACSFSTWLFCMNIWLYLYLNYIWVSQCGYLHQASIMIGWGAFQVSTFYTLICIRISISRVSISIVSNWALKPNIFHKDMHDFSNFKPDRNNTYKICRNIDSAWQLVQVQYRWSPLTSSSSCPFGFLLRHPYQWQL